MEEDEEEEWNVKNVPCRICGWITSIKVMACSEEDAQSKARDERKHLLCEKCGRSLNLTEEAIKVEKINYQIEMATELKDKAEEKLSEVTRIKAETEKIKTETANIQQSITQQRIKHKQAMDWMRKNTYKLYKQLITRIRRHTPDRFLKITELWEEMKIWITTSITPLELRLTITEFQDIFGKYPQPMNNSRLYDISYELGQDPDIERIGSRPYLYRYIGVKENETKTE